MRTVEAGHVIEVDGLSSGVFDGGQVGQRSADCIDQQLVLPDLLEQLHTATRRPLVQRTRAPVAGRHRQLEESRLHINSYVTLQCVILHIIGMQ